jgi:hypothetical protein
MANDPRAFTIFYLTIILLPFAIPVVHGATRLVSSLMLGTAAALRSAVRHTGGHTQDGRAWPVRQRQTDAVSRPPNFLLSRRSPPLNPSTDAARRPN